METNPLEIDQERIEAQVSRHLKKNPFVKISKLHWTKRPEALIEGFLPDKGVVVIAAAPHTGKTFLAIEMARAVSTGTPFLGKYATKQGKVLVIEQDSADWDFRVQYEKVTGESLEASQEEIEAQDFVELGISDHVSVSLEPIKWLNSDDFVDELVYWVKQDVTSNFSMETDLSKLEEIQIKEGFDLIILDSLAALHDFEENSNAAMHAVINRLRRLANKTNSCVVVLHHINKSREDGVDTLSLDRLRGASAITAAADCIFGLYKRHRFSTEINVLMLKNRAFPEMRDISYYFNQEQAEEEGQLDRVMLTTSSNEPGTTSFRINIITNHLIQAADWVETSILIAQLMEAEKITDARRYKTFQNATYRVLNQLEQEEKIERQHGKVKWNTPPMTITGDIQSLFPG